MHEHELILNAILAEDEAALKEAITIHIESARTSIGLILKVNKMF
ncbi:hypothetical protein [Petroclostridium sp. X23]|nr:hypothetical protein [Petroclostridium sp. X23]WHH58506.1 hypothetical protein QKW49_22345 [Petroclostridium sp. X23]